MTCIFAVRGLMYITAESKEFNAIKKFGLQVEPLLRDIHIECSKQFK